MNNDTPLDDITQAIIAEGRYAISPGDLERLRVQRVVEAKLAAQSSVVNHNGRSLVAWARWAAAIGITGAVAVGYAYRSHHDSVVLRQPTPPLATRYEPVPNGLAVPASNSGWFQNAPHVATAVASTHLTSDLSQGASARSEQVSEEIGLLTGVNSAIHSGSGARALQLLQDFDRRFRSPVLKEERAAAGVLALCATGRSVEARAAAEKFAARWPRSPLSSRIAGSCVVQR